MTTTVGERSTGLTGGAWFTALWPLAEEAPQSAVAAHSSSPHPASTRSISRSFPAHLTASPPAPVPWSSLPPPSASSSPIPSLPHAAPSPRHPRFLNPPRILTTQLFPPHPTPSTRQCAGPHSTPQSPHSSPGLQTCADWLRAYGPAPRTVPGA